MASYDDNKKFRDSVFGDILDTSIDWIQVHLTPDDVFDEDKIIEHVRDNIELDDVYPHTTIVEYVTETCTPSEVFTQQDLEDWAADNGWIKEEEQ